MAPEARSGTRGSRMGRQIKVLLIGAAFTVVAMGFAYAVPRAMHTAAGGSKRDSILLLNGSKASPVPSAPSDDGCEAPTASEVPSPSEPPVASEQPASKAPVDSEEPCDDEDGGDPEDPAGEEGDGSDVEGNGGSTTNHGSAVRVAAHCDVRGRAHGELVRSIAQDKDATVASAEQACADARSAAPHGASTDEVKDKAKPNKGKKSHVREDVAKGAHGGGSGSSKKTNDPPAPKTANPAKVKVSGGGGPTSPAPANSASKGKSKVKSK